jgi:hypothetical protein
MLSQNKKYTSQFASGIFTNVAKETEVVVVQVGR